jgi:putative ABC transport system ATP-binding protein
MRELTDRKRGAALTTTLACDFSLFHLEADLRWLEHNRRPPQPPLAGAVMTGPLLSATDLHLSFGETTALAGVSVSVQPGEVLRCSDPQGPASPPCCTASRGSCVPTRAEVRFRGDRIDDLGTSAAAACAPAPSASSSQFGSLVPELSATENVALPLRLAGSSARRPRSVLVRGSTGWGVASVAAQAAGQMSGGQGQRVAVARALVGAPRVVFADEPTVRSTASTASSSWRSSSVPLASRAPPSSS